MKNILLNIIIRKNSSREHLEKLIKSCVSEKYNVYISISDYTLNHEVMGYNLHSQDNIFLHEFDYEDISNRDKHIIQIIGGLSTKTNFLCFMNIDFLLSLEENFIDQMSLTCLEDQLYGCVYSDYYAKSKSGTKTVIYQKSMPLMSATLPLIAFSADNYFKNVGQENIEMSIIQNLISKHVPRALCAIDPNV
tara:strand:- start:770 stop:1345 length:576 start_codon:yes stop_codon:yes gene_type:complete